MSSQPNEAPARPDGPVSAATAAGSAEPAAAASVSESGPAPRGVLPGPASPSSQASGQNSAGPGTHVPAGEPADGRTLWKVTADGRAVFRRGTPYLVWWGWVVFAIFNIAQVAIPDHDYFSVELIAGLLAVTAIVYATTIRPRVIASDDGLSVCNPFRDHRVGWGALNAVYLGDSVELSCARPAPRKDKTIYCWALYSARRSRMRARLRAERGRSGLFGLPGRASDIPSRAPAEAQHLARQDPVQIMAAEIGRRSADAKQRGVPAAVLASGWAWWPLAYLLGPAALLLSLLLAR